MSQFDELPEDIRDIAARLSAARANPTPLELDELRRRVHGRAARAPQGRGLRQVLRNRFVAVMLTMGLVFSSGVGVVLACSSVSSGGGSDWTWPISLQNASWCQYHGSQTYTYSWHTKHTILTVDLFWDCKHLTVGIHCGEPFNFQWGGGGWNDVDLDSYSSTAPNLSSPLTISTDGSTYLISSNGTAVVGGSAPSYNVTFNANGGSGSMATETENAPTALSADSFTRSGYTFAGWNTSASGAGTAYGNDATFPFTANTTLYAQWTRNPTTVTFNANGGSGSMAAETKNVPTALSADAYTRAGYSFTGWNTSASGNGTAYAAGATYSFAANTTLYAQWKANPSFTVTFNSNGGSGTMAAETKNVPTVLTADTYSRSGYTFSGWNTSASGTGTAYANGATYPFTASTTLYAQWHK
jgi:uncharacterized repeat protein (TIGR02543 family)